MENDFRRAVSSCGVCTAYSYKESMESIRSIVGKPGLSFKKIHLKNLLNISIDEDSVATALYHEINRLTTEHIIEKRESLYLIMRNIVELTCFMQKFICKHDKPKCLTNNERRAANAIGFERKSPEFVVKNFCKKFADTFPSDPDTKLLSLEFARLNADGFISVCNGIISRRASISISHADRLNIENRAKDNVESHFVRVYNSCISNSDNETKKFLIRSLSRKYLGAKRRRFVCLFKKNWSIFLERPELCREYAALVDSYVSNVDLSVILDELRVILGSMFSSKDIEMLQIIAATAKPSTDKRRSKRL